MTITQQYTRIHDAFDARARAITIQPFDIRVVVAIADRRGEATSQQIAEDVGTEGSAVRRSLGKLYAHHLADGEGADGGRRRKGIVTRVRLTEAGWAIARDVRVAVEERILRAA